MISEKGIELIKSFEGFRQKPYLDSEDTPTIGYGTTIYPDGRNVTLADSLITRAQADQYLKAHLQLITPFVVKLLPTDIGSHQLDAVLSFVYNLGLGRFKGSSLLKKIRLNKQDPSIRAEFLKWVNAGGKPLEGLRRRREAEADLYFLT